MDISKYEDILYMERPVSENHPPMPMYKRAAQFAMFNALVGYTDSLAEEERETDPELLLGEDRIAEINEALQTIQEYKYTHANVKVNYFVPDRLKSGGDYKTYIGKVLRVDEYHRELVLADKRRIAFIRIADIEIL